jgi:hypothetical protein
MKPCVSTRAAVAVAVAAAAATGIAAAQPASVSGTMTIHGAPIELRHAIAQSYASPPGGAVSVYAIALTDRPLPEGALDGPEGAGVRRLAYEKKVRGLLLLIEPSDPSGATAVALDAFGTKGLKASIIKFGEPDWQKLGDFKVAGNRVSAKAVREWPNDPVHYRLAFDVPLTPEPSVVHDAKGAEAVRASPAWQAASAHVDRMLKLKATPKTIAALQAGFGPTARAQNEVVLQHFLDDRGFADHTKKRAREMRSALDSASRVVERGRWATIVPADAKAKPIELVAGEGGRWLLGQ